MARRSSSRSPRPWPWASRPYLATKDAGKRLWPGNAMDYGSAVMIRKDLASARKAWADAGKPLATKDVKENDFLAFENSKHEFADFHSLRAAYGSNAVREANAKTYQELMRHSDPGLALTKYAKSSETEMRLAIESMPTIPLPELQLPAAK